MTPQEFEAIKKIVNNYDAMSSSLSHLKEVRTILTHGKVEKILIKNHLGVQTHEIYGKTLPAITPVILEQVTTEIDRLESCLAQMSIIAQHETKPDEED